MVGQKRASTPDCQGFGGHPLPAISLTFPANIDRLQLRHTRITPGLSVKEQASEWCPYKFWNWANNEANTKQRCKPLHHECETLTLVNP